MTVIELLIASAIFLVILGVLGAMLSGSTRAYRTTSERSEAIQDSEAVLQLIRYDLGRAGFRGVDDGAYNRQFGACTPSEDDPSELGSGRACQTVRIDDAGAAGDTVSVRFFETQYLSGTDSGERLIAYSVDLDERALIRQQGAAQGQLLVGSIDRLVVSDLVDRSRATFPVADLRTLQPAVGGSDGELQWPSGLKDLAGLNLLITFADGTTTEFLVGFHNPQLFAVE